MDPLEWILSFVDQISAPSKAMAQSVRALRGEIKALQDQVNRTKIDLPGVGGHGGGGAARRGAGDNQMRQFAAMWGQVGRRMQAQETQAQKAFDRLRLQEARAQERATAKAEKDAIRVAKAQAKAQEAAAHKPYFGGHKSISDLLRARASSKISGMATGAADALLGAPGRVLSGAGGALGGALGALGSMAEGAAGVAFNLGKAAVSAQAMREDSVEAMTKLFNSSDKANQLFEVARTAAKQTKFDTADVVKSFTSLATGGFKADEVEKVFWTVADVESKMAGAGALFTTAISKLRGGGGVAGFAPFQSAARAGPGLDKALPELAKQMGLQKVPTRGEAMKLFRTGKVSRDVAINTLLESTNTLLNTATHKAGEFAKAVGGSTWSGVISNIKNAMADLLSMKMSDEHPINRFKDFLKAIGAKGGILDSESRRGREFESIISDIVADIFRLVGLDTTGINNAMDSVLTIGRAAQQTFAMFVDFVRREVFPAVQTALSDINSVGVEQALTTLATKITTVLAKAIVGGIADALNTAIIESIPGGAKLDSLISRITGIKSSYRQARTGSDVPIDVGGSLIGGAVASSSAPSSGGKFSSSSMGLPSYDKGGFVPGPYGAPQLAIVHSGEWISGLGGGAASGGSARGGGAASMPDINVTVQFAGNAGDMDESDIKGTVKQGIIEGWLAAMELTTSMQGMGPRP